MPLRALEDALHAMVSEAVHEQEQMQAAMVGKPRRALFVTDVNSLAAGSETAAGGRGETRRTGTTRGSNKVRCVMCIRAWSGLFSPDLLMMWEGSSN